jgi:hypothetical protein
MTLESLVPRTRNIALIGHDFKHDLHVLQILKFDLQTSIVGILDIQKIASDILPDNSSTLRVLATSFKRFNVLSISFTLLVTMHTSLYEHYYY